MGQVWASSAEAQEGAEAEKAEAAVSAVLSDYILPELRHLDWVLNSSGVPRPRECPICLDADGHTLVPCRVCIYAICGRCIVSLEQPLCPFCRSAWPYQMPGLRPVASVAMETDYENEIELSAFSFHSMPVNYQPRPLSRELILPSRGYLDSPYPSLDSLAYAPSDSEDDHLPPLRRCPADFGFSDVEGSESTELFESENSSDESLRRRLAALDLNARSPVSSSASAEGSSIRLAPGAIDRDDSLLEAAAASESRISSLDFENPSHSALSSSAFSFLSY